jgi:Uri superfamily endonuclease
MKGTYVLLAKLEKDRAMKIGSLGSLHFRKGFYAYAGSGMNSLEKRIERHLKRRKRIFWHIDYFLQKARIVKIFFLKARSRNECETARALAGRFAGIRGFGCSDCGCESHLFYAEKLGALEKEAAKALRSSRARPRLFPCPRPSAS